MRYTGFRLMALAILVITVLAACGGGSDDSGGSGSTSTSTPFQATPASPAEVSSTQASPSRAASTSATASSSVPAPTSEPTVVAPKPTSPPEPTEAPAKVSLPAPVTMFNCEDQFRQMLVDYDGVEEFGAEVVTRLSGEFTEVRPDCLAQGWNPEFPVEPLLCREWTDLPGSLQYKITKASGDYYISPTMRSEVEDFARMPEGVVMVTWVRMNIHLNRVPLLSDVPAKISAGAGSLVGGCWTYKGVRGVLGVQGVWSRTFINYSTQAAGRVVVVNRARPDVIALRVPLAFPECDSLLQSALSKGLDAGETYDGTGVGDVVDVVRGLAGGACDSVVGPWGGWLPGPVDGPAQGCPVMAPTGVQGDRTFVLHWPEEDHFDGYGASACWVRSPEGEWGSYLRKK